MFVSACTPTRKVWHKPGMTQDEWALDRANCQSRAQRLAEEDHIRFNHQPQGGLNTGAHYDNLMRGHNARKSYESIYRGCLERLGYKLITPKPKTSKSA